MTVLRICFVGDSLTLGTNDDEYLGWPGRIAKRERAAGHDVTVYNLGVRADTSEMIASAGGPNAKPGYLKSIPAPWSSLSASTIRPSKPAPNGSNTTARWKSPAL